ncbi:Crp/Fnr family transcriptional regulator (plasmid) [Flammeovirga sp. MY04]|uniref:Crp/Fnr family transcriptional regulator n=1 Tax=Flammeovirga sp. MY04 TaxID=1191459 RepID=UPI000824582E|nr:Crp/Fnr family transcriptional regulator [Flammeovirga sp. MY04]ANQ52891.2 Crp/Fnr family transcriptional regulator [Flammeovirga sp. MY04]
MLTSSLRMEFSPFFKNTISLVPDELMVINSNTNNKRVFLVGEGKVFISKISPSGEEIVYEILQEGDFFNQKMLLDLFHMNDIYITAGNQGAKLYYLSCTDAKSLKNNCDKFNELITKAIQKNIFFLESRIEVLSFKTPYERISRFIYHLHEYKKSNEIHHNFSHEDISKLTRVSRPLVTKVMNEMKNEGKIFYQRGVIKILNNQMLFQNI